MLIKVGLTGNISKEAYILPGFLWSVYIMERAGDRNVLYTQCVLQAFRKMLIIIGTTIHLLEL